MYIPPPAASKGCSTHPEIILILLTDGLGNWKSSQLNADFPCGIYNKQSKCFLPQERKKPGKAEVNLRLISEKCRKNDWDTSLFPAHI